MTERIVRPIRAWADYDECSMFADHFTDLAERHRFEAHVIPKTGKGSLYAMKGFGIEDLFARESAVRGPLRSLRVLYENGWWLELAPRVGTTAANEWFWYLHEAQDAPEIPHGNFAEDKDSEAVERALIAAAAWLSQAEVPV